MNEIPQMKAINKPAEWLKEMSQEMVFQNRLPLLNQPSSIIPFIQTKLKAPQEASRPRIELNVFDS